jgi:hypothetical protein
VATLIENDILNGFQILTGDVTTGTIYILLTGKTVPVGKFCLENKWQ